MNFDKVIMKIIINNTEIRKLELNEKQFSREWNN